MTKTLITFNANTIVVRYVPSAYSTATNKQTRDVVELIKKTSASSIYIDAILTEDSTSAEISWKVGVDYFIGLAADITVSIVQELKQFVFTLTSDATSSYIIAATTAVEAASIAAAQTVPLVGTVTSTLAGSYYGQKGIVSPLV